MLISETTGCLRCGAKLSAGTMLTNPEAASVARAGIARCEAQIAQAILADDANLRAAIISAITLGITVSRYLIKSDELANRRPGAGH